MKPREDRPKSSGDPFSQYDDNVTRPTQPYKRPVSLYWIRYRLGEHSVGGAVFEASVRAEARLKAALGRLDEAFDYEAFAIAPTAARQIPESMIGHMLSRDELAWLAAKFSAKNPGVVSVFRHVPRKRLSIH